MSYDHIHLARESRKCGAKFKQLVSFVEEKGRITVKVYRYKCPFCDSLTRKPIEEEIRECMRH
ncbi:MAG: hypothetical protein JSV75_02695 [Candidatus Bathyarchaeota archaeon]|nr:MAG: hypothetical protein JSV75_02695 [Candidatus Bathyarchaeota archaeon]